MSHRLAAIATSLLVGLSTAIAHAEPAAIGARRIEAFKTGSEQRRFGPFQFLGGLELYSWENPLFGAWSAIRIRPDGEGFVGVFDTGHWFSGRLLRGADGRLAGIADASIDTMLDRAGERTPGKSRMDAESLAFKDDSAFVGFEQWHRVDRYPGGPLAEAVPDGTVVLPFAVGKLRGNGSLEMLAAAPQNASLRGALIAITEKSVDAKGNLYAGILDGPQRGSFSVVRRDGFDVTDGAFLPNGDLLLLERRFSLSTGIGMRIALIRNGDIRRGAVIEPQTLLEAGGGYQIDNMEGLDVFRADDGTLHVIIVSDDNHSILQRNLMLEFRYLE